MSVELGDYLLDDGEMVFDIAVRDLMYEKEDGSYQTMLVKETDGDKETETLERKRDLGNKNIGEMLMMVNLFGLDPRDGFKRGEQRPDL